MREPNGLCRTVGSRFPPLYLETLARFRYNVCCGSFSKSPEILMPFQQLGLSPSLARNALALGYLNPTPIQAQAIPAVLSGRDLVATAQTGTGKTAAFLLPVMHSLLGRPRGSTGALVLTPTRELAEQIELVFRGLAVGTPLRSALVMGGVPGFPQERALRGGVDLVVATPGRLLDHLGRGFWKTNGLTTLILDEADQMFDLGFLPTVKQIISRLPARKQTLLFSATMPDQIASLGRAILRDPQTVSIGRQGTAVAAVSQAAYPVPKHLKAALLQHLLEQWETPSVLVFTRTKHGAKKLATTLYDSGHGVAELHSNRSPNQRARAMQAFRGKAVPVMVATNIAARGIDVRHITHVVNFDVPDAPEEYVHRIGRTGRAGDAGASFVLVSPEENGQLARIERHLGKRIPREHLADFDYQAGPLRSELRPAHAKIAEVAFKGRRLKASRGQGSRR
jgi:ATP-dependent RNA helicase RhlE